MAMRVGGFNSVRPMNFQVSNYSKVSDVFEKEVNNVNGVSDVEGVDIASPVQYATAKAAPVDPTAKLANIQKADKAYNEIADSFSGATTGYNNFSVGSSYATTGSNIDIYA